MGLGGKGVRGVNGRLTARRMPLPLPLPPRILPEQGMGTLDILVIGLSRNPVAAKLPLVATMQHPIICLPRHKPRRSHPFQLQQLLLPRPQPPLQLQLPCRHQNGNTLPTRSYTSLHALPLHPVTVDRTTAFKIIVVKITEGRSTAGRITEGRTTEDMITVDRARLHPSRRRMSSRVRHHILGIPMHLQIDHFRPRTLDPSNTIAMAVATTPGARTWRRSRRRASKHTWLRTPSRSHTRQQVRRSPVIPRRGRENLSSSSSPPGARASMLRRAVSTGLTIEDGSRGIRQRGRRPVHREGRAIGNKQVAVKGFAQPRLGRIPRREMCR